MATRKLKRAPRWLAGLTILAAVAAGCSADDSDSALLTTADDTAEGETVQQTQLVAVAEDSAPREIPTTTFPGQRDQDRIPAAPAGSLVMGGANWDSGYIQAQILHDLVEELGYEVTAPGEREFAPDRAYQAMAQGKIDFWANSWYPGHLSWWEGEPTPGGGAIGDSLVRIDSPMAPGAGLQGWLVTKAWAEANDVTTLDQINADPGLWQQLDSDGDGKGEFYGCPEHWTCDDIMESMVLFAEWGNLEQTRGDYDPMFDEFLAKAEDGEPAIAYTWAPTSYLARAKLGDSTMWLSTLDDSVHDDSNPLQIDRGPPRWACQRCDGTIGFKELGPDVCLYGPDGCQLGWQAADIEITANRDRLADYPQVEALFNEIRFSANELSQLLLAAEQAGGSEEAVERVAATWIADNRDTVDAWLDAAGRENEG